MTSSQVRVQEKVVAGVVFAGCVLFTAVAFASTTAGLVPVSDGAYTQWTPSTSTSHFAMVDESACNGLTDYNSTSVVGNKDSYGVSVASVPAGATITQIDIAPCASRVTGGGANSMMSVFYRLNGIDSANAGAYSLTGTTPVALATTTFGSLSIIKSSTTTLEIGAVLTSGTKGARLSRMATVLTYAALTAPTGLLASSSTASTTVLRWTDTSSNEFGFAIERMIGSSTWSGIATTTANITSYFDTGLAATTTYSYRVRAYNSGAYSAYSNTATTTTM